MAEMAEMAEEALGRARSVVLGKDREILEVLLAFLADGHVLLEDIPGVGKTTLALAFSRIFDLDYRRVQFTPDVLPSDLTGFSIYRRDREEFVYQPGSVFCNLLLADELNRASPKTQSALLEVMEERQVTVEGVTREVPKPFLVIATQNPPGSAGVQPLAESQADRFFVSLSLGYPDFDSEVAMARAVGPYKILNDLRPVASARDLRNMQFEIHRIFMHDAIYDYLVRLITATREHPALTRGASPRATVALVKLSKAAAWSRGRDFVTPSDVLEQFPYVAAHRVRIGPESGIAGADRSAVLEILRQIGLSVRKPRMEARR